MTFNKTGFDVHAITRKDDKLNRWEFAKEIYEIAKTTPQEWSIRIGIYGDWGTGKTSVLSFIDQMAQKDENIPVYFNPWQYSSSAEMWIGFVSEVYNALKDVPGISNRNKKIKAFFSEASGYIEQGKGIDSRFEAAVNLGVPLLKKYTSFGSADVFDIPKKLKEKKLIIFIDDIDRANPKLIPELLFALKEILDVPGFCFILGFAPEIIGPILNEYHKGFGDGLQFLEKIIDYPRWLPTPTKENLMNMAEYTIKKHCSFVDPAALLQIQIYLPSNPRALKQFIRQLIVLKGQVNRYNPEELHWPSILLANLIKVQFPKVAYQIFSNKDFFTTNLYVISFENDQIEEEYKKILTKVAELTGIKDIESNNEYKILPKMILELSRISYLKGDIIHHAMLNEHPKALTKKEFNEIVQNNHDKIDKISSLLKAHASKHEFEIQDVYNLFLSYLINDRLHFMGIAIEKHSIEEVKANLQKTEELFTVIQPVLETAFLKDIQCSLNKELITQLWDMIKQYYHFQNPIYKELREKENAFIINLAKQHDNCYKYWLELFPVYSGRHIDDGIPVDHINLEEIIREEVFEKYTMQIISHFLEAGFINSINLQENYIEKDLLFGQNSIILNSPYRDELLDLINNNQDNSNLYENIWELLLDCENNNTDNYLRWLNDAEVTTKLLSIFLAKELQPRTIGTINKVMKKLTVDGGFGYCYIPPLWLKAQLS